MIQQQTTNQNIFPIKPLIFLIGLGLVGIILMGVLSPGWGRGNDVPVANGKHALAKHTADAKAIHKCLDGRGPSEVWKVTSLDYPNHFIQTCQLNDGRWGIRVIQWTKDRIFKEKTSFVIKDGTKEQLVEYLTARARPFAGKLGDFMAMN
jgi:hypothetical protein